MKDFIPTEEDFETLLSSLSSHERFLATEIIIQEALSRVDLNDVEAFSHAFSAPPPGMKPKDEKRILAETQVIRDKLILIRAKLIEFRNHIRVHTTDVEIADLLK